MAILVAASKINNVQTFVGTPVGGDPSGGAPRQVLGFLVDFSAGGTISGDLNLQAQLSQAQISFIQSIKIDNTLNAAQVDVTFVGSQDHIRVPPNSIAVAQVHVSNPPILSISCSGGTGATLFFVTNVMMQPTIASTVSVTSPFIFNGSGYALVADPILDGCVIAGVLQVSISGAAPVGGKMPVTDAILDACVTANVVATSNAVLAACIAANKVGVSDAAIEAIISGGKLAVADAILDACIAANKVAVSTALDALVVSSALTVNQQNRGGTFTSRSTVTVATTSTQLMAANAARQYLIIGAPQSQGIWLNPIGGAASAAGADCFFLGAGQIWEKACPGDYVWQSAITYYSAAASLEIPAGEA